MKNLLILAVLAFGFVGCKQVNIPNGEIPAQYLDLAKTYMGTYSGNFSGNNGSLKLELVGSKVVGTFSGEVNDILGDVRCGSIIGNLTSIQIDDSARVLQAAKFDFSPNQCNFVMGRSLNLDFSKDQRSFHASILKDSYPLEICNNGYPYPFPRGPRFPGPFPQCRIEYQNTYLDGQFQR